MKTIITLEINGIEMKYNSEVKEATLETKSGVLITCKIPDDFDLTKVFLHMQSILKIHNQII